MAEGLIKKNVPEVLRFAGTKSLVCCTKTILRAVKSFHAAVSASSLLAVDVAGDVAVKSARVVASMTTPSHHRIYFECSWHGYRVTDILVLGVTIYNLAKGSETSSKKLREIANTMTLEMNQVTKIIEKQLSMGRSHKFVWSSLLFCLGINLHTSYKNSCVSLILRYL